MLAFDEQGKFVDGVKEAISSSPKTTICIKPAASAEFPPTAYHYGHGGEMRRIKTGSNPQGAAAIVNSLRPEDSVAILPYADRVEIAAEWTNDREQLLAAIGGQNSDASRHSSKLSALAPVC